MLVSVFREVPTASAELRAEGAPSSLGTLPWFSPPQPTASSHSASATMCADLTRRPQPPVLLTVPSLSLRSRWGSRPPTSGCLALIEDDESASPLTLVYTFVVLLPRSPFASFLP